MIALLAGGASAALAQVRPLTPPTPVKGDDQTGAFLPAGVESADQATERVRSHKPDPVKSPVARTPWDGKPDFSGVYWPTVAITPAPVPLESLYRPDVREYREGGGAARGLIDWRGIDSPAYHCWPPSPVKWLDGADLSTGIRPGIPADAQRGRRQPSGSFQSPGNGRQPEHARRPSFQGSSVGHWEGDTLVVEVTNFNGKPWLGARHRPPQTSSDALRVVERWSRPDGQTLEYQAVVEDPEMLTAPWTGPVQRRGMLPYDSIQEALCVPDPELYARHREYAASAAGRRSGGPGPGRGGRGARGGGR